MASSSSSSHSIHNTSPQSWNHDVFISFRGEDTRKTFVDHLYTSLCERGIYTYKDDEALPRGESIGPALLKAIRESRIAVIVFSENYADSSWCLDELEYIMKCKDERGQIVMPVFYHVDPSEVRKQKRKYGEAFTKHENMHIENKVESWRKALSDAGNLSGWVPKDILNGHESKLIKEIGDTIVDRLDALLSYASEDSEDLVGMGIRLKHLKSQLEIGADDVRMVGIWGVGGGGKTTLASSLYDEVSSKFDGCCFIENIREISSKDGLEKLQEKILSDILKQKQVRVGRVEEGKRLIKSRLCHKSVLIVLDDVDHLDHLKALAGSHDWFGKGSRIIITTRNNQLLNAHKVNVIHPISLLNADDAIKLFCMHAPRDSRIVEDYELLSKDIVSYAGGLPLALKVLGCFLCDKDISEWRSALARLKEIPDDEIVEKLKISYDGLKPVEKELFLDIACFFRIHFPGPYYEEKMMILDACGFHPIIGVKVLSQKALITIDAGGNFDMHDLVQEMAHYIVRCENPKNPAQHTRVWQKEDVLNICAMDEATDLNKIEAIRYHCDTEVVPQRLFDVVANMKKLRWISLTLGWRHTPAPPPLPENFPPRELCSLMLSGSLQKQLWKGFKYLPHLKVIKLEHLVGLLETPDVSGLPNLERFTLRGCPKLIKIHPSIGHLESLVYLVILHCPNLKTFPSITQMKNLKTLELSWCPGLSKPSEIQQNIDNMDLDMSGKLTASHEQHSTSFFSTNLTFCCSNLDGNTHEELSDVEPCSLEAEASLLHNNIINHIRLQLFHCGLRELILRGCNLEDGDMGSDFWDLPNLQILDLRGNSFSRLPCSLLQFPMLKRLEVSGCNNLVELSGLPSSIAVVLAENCNSLESVGNVSNCKWLWNVSLARSNKVDPLSAEILLQSMLEGNAFDRHPIILFYNFDTRVVSRLASVKRYTLQLPHHWYHDFCGFIIRAVSDYMHVYSEITIKQELDEDSYFETWKESDESYKPVSGRMVNYVAYVFFSSLRHATWLSSTCNMITFLLETDGVLSGVELVPRKGKSDPLQTTKVSADCSEFGDEEFALDRKVTIRYDSKSSVRIRWYLPTFII